MMRENCRCPALLLGKLWSLHRNEEFQLIYMIMYGNYDVLMREHDRVIQHHHHHYPVIDPLIRCLMSLFTV